MFVDQPIYHEMSFVLDMLHTIRPTLSATLVCVPFSTPLNVDCMRLNMDHMKGNVDYIIVVRLNERNLLY